MWWCFPFSCLHVYWYLLYSGLCKKPCWWDIMGIAFLTFLWDAVSQQTSCSSNSVSLSVPTWKMYPEEQDLCYRCICWVWAPLKHLSCAFWSFMVFSICLCLMQREVFLWSLRATFICSIRINIENLVRNMLVLVNWYQ